MVKLETVEDFEKIKKALDNPRSQVHQYCVKQFGYCTACRTLTEEEGNYSMESCTETCLRCKREFVPGGLASRFYGAMMSNDHNYYYTHSTREFIPSEFHDRYDELNSREFQRRIFANVLEAFLKKEKAKVRKLQSNIRQLAKLR